MMKCAIYYTMLVLYASQVYAQKSTDPQDALSAENILKSVKIQNIVFETMH